MSTPPFLVHVLQDQMGGIAEFVRLLLRHASPQMPPQGVVWVRSLLDANAPSVDRPTASYERAIGHGLPGENLYAALRRLRRAIPPGPGVLVAHDWLELALLHRYDPGRAVVQVLHGDMDYYYALSRRHQGVVDRFVTYSHAVFERLRGLLPARARDIALLHYGVEIPSTARARRGGPLRCCFLGRLDHAHKGILLLPAVDRHLARQGVLVSWTVIGEGPDGEALRRAWRDGAAVRHLGALPNAAAREALLEQDLFVLPTRAEGFPVALLEAMAAGVVPVTSDVRSGISEVVENGTTGERVRGGDPEAFGRAIRALHEDRAHLERMSAAARARVCRDFDVRARIGAWESFFRSLPPRRKRAPSAVPYGSRLDRPWLPNAVVRLARGVRRKRPGGAAPPAESAPPELRA